MHSFTQSFTKPGLILVFGNSIEKESTAPALMELTFKLVGRTINR
jgi:hypothetical protein